MQSGGQAQLSLANCWASVTGVTTTAVPNAMISSIVFPISVESNITLMTAFAPILVAWSESLSRACWRA